MSKNRSFYIIFFGLLVVGFFLALAFTIPGFTKQKFPPIGRLSPFRFTNQDGGQVTENALSNKVVAVNYFFTTCKGICPKMTNNLLPVYQQFKNEPEFLMISHTCQPERDSAAVLRRYADSIKVDTKKWIFLTGRKDSLYSMARHTYKIDDPKNFVQNVDDEFLHSQFIALINKKGEVVKIYDGIKPSEIKDMEEQIRTLLKE